MKTRIPWAAIACVSIGGAFLNLAVTLLDLPPGLESLADVAASLSLGTLLLSILHLLVWLALAAICDRTSQSRTPLLPATSVLIIGGSLFTPLFSWYAWADPARRLVMVASLVMLLLALGATAWLLALRWNPKPKTQRLISALLHALPWLGAASFAFVWLQVYRLEDWRSVESLYAALGYAAVCAVALLLSWGQFFQSYHFTSVIFGLVVSGVFFPAYFPQARAVSASQRAGSCLVMLSVDTLRADMLRGINPNAPAHPNLDRLLDESLVFSQARSVAPWTRPAMASVMTGLTPWEHGAVLNGLGLPQNVSTLAERARDAGYRTAAIGSNPVIGEQFNFDQGFDFFRFYSRPWLGVSLGARAWHAIGPDRSEATTAEVTRQATDWLADNAGGGGFFLWLHYLDPHAPYSPPSEYIPKGPIPPRIGTSFTDMIDMQGGRFFPSVEEQHWIRKLYAAEFRYVDDQIGVFLETLRKMDLYDTCSIIFLSDHGEEFWEHDRASHGHSLYEELIHVPLAIKLPFQTDRDQIDKPISTASVMATAMRLLELKTATQVEIAPELQPLWEQSERSISWPPHVATAAGDLDKSVSRGGFGNQDAVIIDGLKYLFIEEMARSRVEVYDLRSDPQELHSIEASSEQVAAARAALDEAIRKGQKTRSILGLETGASAELDPGTANALRALGYLE